MGDEFNIEDLQHIKINEELNDYLTSYVGVLPKYLRLFIIDYSQYEDNLREHNQYDKVMSEYYAIRMKRKKTKDKDKYDEEEFNNFIKKNPKIKNILLKSLEK